MQVDTQSFFKQGIFLSLSPQKLLLGSGELKWQENPSPSRISFYAPRFFLQDGNPWIVPEHVSEVDSQEVQVHCHLNSHLNNSFYWKRADPIFFRQQIEELQQYFSSGKLSKAVPIVFEEADYEKDFHQAAFAHLLNSCNERLYTYGFWTDQNEGMLGATPEILFESARKGHFQTMALAGTNPSDKKDCAREHQVVIEDIVASLRKYGKVTVQETQELAFADLRHLQTLIELETGESLSFLDLISVLHPTAALGAIPKREGSKWLETLNQKYDRRRFGSPFGVLWPDGRSLVVVAIRSVQWDSKKIILGAGSGVLEGVDFDQEWNEIQLKMESVKKMMGFA